MDDLTIEDSSNIAGMGYLINTSDTNAGFDVLQLEDEIASKTRNNSKRGNLAQELESEIDRVMGNKDYKFNEPSSSRPFIRPSEVDNLDELLRTIDDDDDAREEFGPTAVPQSYQRRPGYNQMEDQQFGDPRLDYMTNEEKRQNVIGEVFDDIKEENGSNVIISIEKEKEEDEKARKLEQICFLRETLEDEGEDLKNVSNVSHANTLDEIDATLRLLILKNDRKRCCSFAEECILLGAHSIEWAFDGKKDYFGHKPDMTDWHKSVQGKLRRMRHDTSNVVGAIMASYNLGSGTRILLELIPSMFLYSKMRRAQHKDSLISDDEFSDGINKLRDFETKRA